MSLKFGFIIFKGFQSVSLSAKSMAEFVLPAPNIDTSHFLVYPAMPKFFFKCRLHTFVHAVPST